MKNTKDMECVPRGVLCSFGWVRFGRRLVGSTGGNGLSCRLTVLMAQLALACKATSRACAKAGIANLFGMHGEQNSSGDDQTSLPLLIILFIRASKRSWTRRGTRRR